MAGLSKTNDGLIANNKIIVEETMKRANNANLSEEERQSACVDAKLFFQSSEAIIKMNNAAKMAITASIIFICVCTGIRILKS